MTFSDEKYRQILRENWGYPDFRGIQLDIIRSIGSGHDTLGLMPTGGGKSITFQVPALSMPGTCLVITPLIALMKDQVSHLSRRGIPSLTVHAGQSRQDMLRNLDNCILGDYKFLYVSPERLESDIFITKLKRMNISFITVDESHCISQWGYDFRPSYLRIAEIRRLLPNAPVLALTATATPEVVNDICSKLTLDAKDGQHDFNVFKMSFERKNLRYIVRPAEDKFAMLLHILKSVDGPSIVYTRSRDGSREIAQHLTDSGVEAIFYHAGLSNTEKDVRQHMWQDEKVRVMVATNAFGMGIDKPNVRLVIHADIPDSVEAYFQEAGRAGRDGKTSYAVLLFNNNDQRKLLHRIPETYPEKKYIARVYESLGSFYQLAVGDGFDVTYEFNAQKFCRIFKFFPTTMTSALKILDNAGYISYHEEEENHSRLIFILTRDELYRIHHLPRLTEDIIQYVLRNYTGIFSDYAYIEEDRIAQACDCTVNDVYEALKAVTYQRILNYIPKKNIPHITFRQRRVETRHLHIPKNVYEDRIEQFSKRITSVLEYASGNGTCRSKYLLAYFGEKAGDCGNCDVCIDDKRGKDYLILAERFLKILSDGEPHLPSDFNYDGFSDVARKKAIEWLISEEKIEFKDGTFRLR